MLEGAKAFRGENGRLRLFRPEQNAIRMQIGAERMCMPSPSTHQFVEAVKEIALANHRWVNFSGVMLKLIALTVTDFKFGFI